MSVHKPVQKPCNNFHYNRKRKIVLLIEEKLFEIISLNKRVFKKIRNRKLV